MLLGYVFHTVVLFPLSIMLYSAPIQPCVCIYILLLLTVAQLSITYIHPFQLPMPPVGLQSPTPTGGTLNILTHVLLGAQETVSLGHMPRTDLLTKWSQISVRMAACSVYTSSNKVVSSCIPQPQILFFCFLT